MSLTAEAKLVECTKEKIHRLGRVQNYGVLIAVDPVTLQVVCVSGTVEEHFQLPPAAFLGKYLQDWFSEESLAAIQQALASPNYTFNNPFQIEFTIDGKTHLFDGVAHVSGGRLLLELEGRNGEVMVPGIDDYFRLTTNSLTSIKPSHTVAEIADIVARDVKAYTGFDRVMVYKFDQDYNGEVIAESREENLEAFLHLRYPASDIPPQARDLYKKSWLRIIRDVADLGEPVFMEAADGSGAVPVGEGLDLSLATLRSVSPIHLQYLKNMGVQASMSISLLTPDGELWGLIACHHYQSPYFLSYAARAACTHYAMVLSSRLTDRERAVRQEMEGKRRKALPQAIRLLFNNENVQQTLISRASVFLDLLQGDGLAVMVGSNVETAGKSLPNEQIPAFCSYLDKKGREADIQTGHQLPPKFSVKGGPAGYLRIRVSRAWQVIVFRNEMASEIRWGGDPSQAVTYDAENRLQPRASFAEYREKVAGCSREWSAIDQAIASDFRSSLSAFVIHRNQHLETLNTQLKRRNTEVQQFAYSVSHDLKSPLVTVNGFIQAIEEDFENNDLEGVHFSLGRIKIAVSRMGRLIDDLLSFSRIGRHNTEPQHIEMGSLLEGTASQFQLRLAETGKELTLPADPLPLYAVQADVERLFQNLVENALKYGGDLITIGCEGREEEVCYWVQDNGPGIDSRYHEKIFQLFERLEQSAEGTGVGLATVARIAEQHGGRATVESKEGAGATFHVTFSKPSHD